MKLKTLAVAVAVAGMPFVAQADLTISGDFGVGYMRSQAGVKTLGEWGSEVNFKASEKVNGIEYFGGGELDISNGATSSSAASVRFDEVHVGASGAFGTLKFGDVNNACIDTRVNADKSWWLGQNGADCKGSGSSGYGHNQTMSYSRSFGPAKVAVSHDPNADMKHSAIGIKGDLGRFAMSLGYEKGLLYNDSTAAVGAAKNIALGMQTGLGPVKLNVDWNRLSPDSNANPDVKNHGVTLSAGKNGYSGYVEAGKTAGVRYTGLGLGKTVGKTDFILEAGKKKGAAKTGYLLGMRHRF